MCKKYIVILILFFCKISTSNSWRPYEIRITNVTSASADANLEVNSTLYEDGSADVYVNAKEALQSLFFHNDLYMIWNKSEYETETLEVINRTIDACKFFQNTLHEPLLQIIYKVMRDHGNFPNRCPIAKGSYFAKNIVFNAENFAFLPERSGLFQLVFYKKISQPIRKLGSVKAYFEIRKTFKKT